MKEFNQVANFNYNVLGIKPRPLGLQNADEYRLSHKQMSEEVGEFIEACDNKDFIGAIDACIDNLVFTMGVLYKMGIDQNTYELIFRAVMKANMEKKIGVKKGREGFKAVDAVKPEGWESPESRIEKILGGLE